MTQNVVTNDEAVTGSQHFIAIFGNIGSYETNLRGTFVDNVKKSPKSTHPPLGVFIQTEATALQIFNTTLYTRS
jgi:hypothetical protein